MERLPVFCGGERIGEAETESERLYIRVTVRAGLRRGLWCAWGIGGRGETRIGVLEPLNGESVISRRISRRSLADAGELSRVELRPAGETSGSNAAANVSKRNAANIIERNAAEISGTGAPEITQAWERTGTARLFRSMRFQRQLRNVREALTRTEGDRRRVALIREEDAPFPIPELFCLAAPARIEARNYWVFTFDGQEWPVLSTPAP